LYNSFFLCGIIRNWDTNVSHGGNLRSIRNSDKGRYKATCHFIRSEYLIGSANTIVHHSLSITYNDKKENLSSSTKPTKEKPSVLATGEK
jgi:hypothetical protein